MYIFIICLFIFVITFLKIGCPFLYLFKIPCPTCGCTRAIIALFRLDIKSYFYYQPFSIPLIISTWSIIHASILKNKKIMYLLSFVILISNFIFYLIKMF